MITFLDENDVEYGALATIKATNAVNGERSLTGTIVSGDYVLSKIERGWRLRFDDEYYVVTYAKPVDEGKNVQVSFDAVHQFFWDFGKSSVYDQLSDGSHTFRAYLDFIFNDSGYRYDIESSLTVKAFEKQSFGYKNRLSLFNDIITSSGVEFQVNGKVVRILAKVGTDLSTVVRKNFNLNELGIEKNIGNFVTYQKGFGAYFDEEDHSKGRLIAEYTSPLASVYGKLEADPLVDERYKQSESLLSALKETVDNSYTISVSLDMEDLTRAGYRYTQPVAGDYIMAINETLGFKEKIRIVSFTSEYDVTGQLIKHTVTCNDIGSVKKLSASYTQTQHQAANAEINANTAYEFANKALVSADGKNTNYYGDSFPVDNPKGTLKKGDLLFLTVGDKVKQYYWNGADWIINPVLDDVEAFKEQIAEDLKDVPNREEFENKIAEELATSKAEITTQIETAKTQAESNAKEYADTINQETAKVAELANAAADEIKADLVNVKDNLTATSIVANNAQAAVDAAKQDLAEVNTKVDSAKAELTQAKQDLTEVASDLNTAKQDLMSHAQQLQTQANAQTELTKRVTTVETTANGTKTTVNELTKTVAQNGKDITSVTNRTKTVEDDLANTKTTLTQVQTTANSTSQKTATLETGLNGVKADLTATTATANTTKTNLANYQASNDKMVASLKSSLQTTDGNVSNLQTKVEAVPGQITSAVSAVEGKIPTTVGGRNYIRDYGLTATGWISLKARWSFEIIKDNTAKSGQYLKATCTTASTGIGGFYKDLFDFSDGRLFGKQMTWSMDVKTSKNTIITIGCEWGKAQTNVNVTENWQRFSKTFKVATSSEGKAWIFYGRDWEVGDIVYIRDVQLEDGSIATSPVPAIEDTESDITKLSSELTQTKDGITLLATKTELNSAKTELQSGVSTATNKANTAQNTANSNAQTISTHTTQISALNTGLQAKVSQTDFNTLSGRVTTAENNITAKANELSSKITSVEGKIPTDVSTRNLILKSNDFANPHKQSGANTEVTSTNEYFVIKSTGYTANAWGGMSWNMSISEAKAGEQFSILMPVYIDSSVSLDNGLALALKNHTSNSVAYAYDIPTNKKDEWFNVAITFKIAGDVTFADYPFYIYLVKNGLVRIKPPMLVRGNLIPSDYQPAFEDTKSDINTLSSQIKQTADGMTLLATKTELNTLSGRVTNAENNITAKANELSSKITSVEGKIPSGEVNLVEYGRPADGYSPYVGAEYSTHGFYYNGAYKMYIFRNTTTSENFFWMNRFKVERNTDYTLYFKGFNNSAITSMDVWFLKRVNGSTNDFDSAQILVGGRKLSHTRAEDVSVTFNTGEYDEGYLRFDNNGTTTAGTVAALYFGDVSVKKGKSNSGWSPSLAELASSQDLKTAQSEFKQTTDAIKASVQSLDNNTVKNSSLTINSDGIVMKAGKSTTDVANAIGSYFAVNQNAINLFSDKINVKGNMIVNGAITSDKIASKSINTAHLNGKIITADVISSNAVTADAIKAGAVTTDKMSANSINGDRITAGTLDAAKIKAGSITASQIASGTITSNQIKAGGISSANIAAGAITGDKIAAGAIDANKIAANAITANMIRGGQLNSTNGATVFDLNAGTLTFNNNYGYIQRVASDKVFEITTYLSTSSGSQEHLTSAFMVRKSDNSRQSGVKFTLYNTVEDKPTAEAKINADALILYDSKNTRLFSVHGKSTFAGGVNFQGWGDIPIAKVHGGLVVNDIGIGGHTKSLLKIVEELCKKAGILWA